MNFGAAMFFTDYSMAPGDLGRALEALGFESSPALDCGSGVTQSTRLGERG